jgi:hypothetical protein
VWRKKLAVCYSAEFTDRYTLHDDILALRGVCILKPGLL